jgi:hypothetical protein
MSEAITTAGRTQINSPIIPFINISGANATIVVSTCLPPGL